MTDRLTEALAAARTGLAQGANGVNRGLAEGLVGLPVDMIAALLRGSIGYNVPPESTVGSTEWIRNKMAENGMGKVDTLPNAIGHAAGVAVPNALMWKHGMKK